MLSVSLLTACKWVFSVFHSVLIFLVQMLNDLSKQPLTSRWTLRLLLVFCCSSRSMTPITETHHRHLSSARFFAVSYPSHMLLISCSLFLPLVHFPVILPSRTSRNNTSCRRTCPSHLHFCWFIVLMIQRFSLTRFRTFADFCCPADLLRLSPYPHFTCHLQLMTDNNFWPEIKLIAW